jgi:5-methylcytosine-specific restriction enzyme A
MSVSLPLAVRVAVFVRDQGRCLYCGARHQDGAQLTIDHVISRKRGGSDALTNLASACRPCNEDKAHFSLRAYLVELQDRGLDTTGVAERVAAALATPIDWSAARQAEALYVAQQRESANQDDGDDPSE